MGPHSTPSVPGVSNTLFQRMAKMLKLYKYVLPEQTQVLFVADTTKGTVYSFSRKKEKREKDGSMVEGLFMPSNIEPNKFMPPKNFKRFEWSEDDFDKQPATY